MLESQSSCPLLKMQAVVVAATEAKQGECHGGTSLTKATAVMIVTEGASSQSSLILGFLTSCNRETGLHRDITARDRATVTMSAQAGSSYPVQCDGDWRAP